MSDDPFDDIDTDPDREGDPFADLASDGDSDDNIDDIDDAEHEESLFEPGQTAGDAHPSGDEQAGADGWSTPDGEDPFSEMDEGWADDDSADGEADPFADLGDAPEGDPFADFGTAEDEALDDSVWENLSASTTGEPVTEERGSRRVSDVPKHQFCEQCEHFTGPPEIACTHEGTDITEFLDMETVRVVDCPVVEEREEVEGGHQ